MTTPVSERLRLNVLTQAERMTPYKPHVTFSGTAMRLLDAGMLERVQTGGFVLTATGIRELAAIRQARSK